MARRFTKRSLLMILLSVLLFAGAIAVIIFWNE